HGLVDDTDVDDLAVRGRDHVLIATRSRTDRVAEEDQKPHRNQKQDPFRYPHPRRPARHPRAEYHERPAGKDEGPAFGGEPHRHPQPNAECGMVNAEWQWKVGRRAKLALTFRIPHSAFRIRLVIRS